MDYKVVNSIKYGLRRSTNTAWVDKLQTTGMSKILILEEIDGCVVDSVSACAFKDNFRIETISLPDSIGIVAKHAFSGCENLKTVRFYETKNKSSLVAFEHDSFENCFELEKLEFASPTPIVIHDKAFVNCQKLKCISGGQIHSVQFDAFWNCFELDNLVFADAAFWRTNSFTKCNNLKNITFLGEISSFIPKTCMKKLKGKNIRCSANSSLANLAYNGWKIETF